MRKIIRGLLFGFILWAILTSVAPAAFATNAICRIVGVTTIADSQKILVFYMVSVNDGSISDYTGAANIDFTSSMNQFLTKIKTKVVNEVILRGGPTLLTTDVWLFGGPQ